MPSRELPQPEPFDLRQYKPSSREEVLHISGLVAPGRKFEEEELVKCVTAMTPRGVIIIDIIHNDYPDDTCQVQFSPDDETKTYHVFRMHWPPIRGDHTGIRIPGEFIEELLYEIFPQIRSKFQEGGRSFGEGELLIHSLDDGDSDFLIHLN